MKPSNFRLSEALRARLRAQAQAHGLSFSTFVRSQLEAAAVRPHDISKLILEGAR